MSAKLRRHNSLPSVAEPTYQSKTINIDDINILEYKLNNNEIKNLSREDLKNIWMKIKNDVSDLKLTNSKSLHKDSLKNASAMKHYEMPTDEIHVFVEDNDTGRINSISFSPDSQPSSNSQNWLNRLFTELRLKNSRKRRFEDFKCTCKRASFALDNNITVDDTKSDNPFERIRSKSLGYVPPAKYTAAFRRCNSAAAAMGLTTAKALRERATLTLTRRYYPEGGWGWTVTSVAVLVHVLSHGIIFVSGILSNSAAIKFDVNPIHAQGWLGPLSYGIGLAISPVTIAFCIRKSTRITAVLGGLVLALGCLFTSFASQFHQLFFSYGIIIGVGVGLTRDCSTLMVAQYFKRKRALVEIFVVSGSGLGIAVMSTFVKQNISSMGWRLGLQAVTGVLFLTFILGTFYRSASLYHPQRRAILHLKNQTKIKKKLKDKTKSDDKPAFFDFSTLKSKTVRLLLISTSISSLGINTPIFYLAYHAEEEGLGERVVSLQTYMGVAWIVGCCTFGVLVLQDSSECRIARQYLMQAAIFVCGLAILALTAIQGNYGAYVIFVWIYGIFCGGYHYTLKMYTYERVRSRNFARAWGFVQCSQAVPIAIGVPLTGYVNVGCGGKAGYYISSTCTFVGSISLLCIDLHRRHLVHKQSRQTTAEIFGAVSCLQDKEQRNAGNSSGLRNDLSRGESPPAADLTCISEEACIDIPEQLLHDMDAITSCNKVENYLMLSEYENNLIAEMPNIIERRGRRWSFVVNNPSRCQGPLRDKLSLSNDGYNSEDDKWKKKYENRSKRLITTINEASFYYLFYL